MAYRITPRAQADLRSIGDYIAERNPSAARHLIGRFIRQWTLLANQPRSGAECDDVLPGIRHKVTGQYVAFYRIEEPDVVILRVLHGKRHIGADDLVE